MISSQIYHETKYMYNKAKKTGLRLGNPVF